MKLKTLGEGPGPTALPSPQTPLPTRIIVGTTRWVAPFFAGETNS
jgi:hypothetical protein